MQYAESLLLRGQLIEGRNADPNTYKDLLCRCPTSGKEVVLKKSNKKFMRWGREFRVCYTWEILEGSSVTPMAKCTSFDPRNEMMILGKNYHARRERLELFRPHLWELILSSAIFEKPVTFEHYDDFQENRLMQWFTEEYMLMCQQENIQARIKEDTQNLYDKCIKNALKKPDNHFPDKAHQIFDDGNHIIYGQQFAGEALELAFQSLETDELQKLIYLGMNEEVSKSIQKFDYFVSNIAATLLEEESRNYFMNLHTKDKYSGMNYMMAIAQQIPEFEQHLTAGFADIIGMCTINLGLIFSCIPWLEELKKFQPQVKNYQ